MLLKYIWSRSMPARAVLGAYTVNSITLTIVYSSKNLFIALGWSLEMIMGFHEYT